MTTYQDPPLHSRRAARQGERAEAATHADPASMDEAAARAVAAGTAEPLNYATTSRPPLPQYDGVNLRPRRLVDPAQHADLPPTEALPRQDVPGFRSKDFSPEGRRAATPSWGPDHGAAGDASEAPAETVAPAVESSVVAAPEADIAATHAHAADVPTPSEHTMTRRELRALREAGVVTDIADLSQPITLPDAPAAAPSVTDVAASDVAAEPIPLVQPQAPEPHATSRLDSAVAEFDALAAGRETALPSDMPAAPGRRAAEPEQTVEPEPFAAQSTEGLSAFDALFQPPSAAIPVIVSSPVDDIVATAIEEPTSDHDVVEAEIVEPETAADLTPARLLVPPATPLVEPPLVDPLLSAPAPQGAPALVPPPPAAYPTPVDLPAPTGPDAVAPAPKAPTVADLFPVSPPAESPVSPAPSGSSDPGVGHWSTQADIDDAEQINESTISRSVGAGSAAITTSALVLPSIPEHSIGGPLGDSGQILLTGSIALPDSLAALGAHPDQLDEADIDHLLDPGDHQVASTDSAPVRAIKAVSTHTASGGIVSPTKPKGTRGFTILIVAASVMAVVVVGLLVAGLVSGTL